MYSNLETTTNIIEITIPVVLSEEFSFGDVDVRTRSIYLMCESKYAKMDSIDDIHLSQVIPDDLFDKYIDNDGVSTISKEIKNIKILNQSKEVLPITEVYKDDIQLANTENKETCKKYIFYMKVEFNRHLEGYNKFTKAIIDHLEK